MKDLILGSRRVRSLVSFAAWLAAASSLAGEPTAIAPGTWVRVTTGPEVKGEGFAVRQDEALSKSVSHDKRTMTFEVKGHAVRFAKPGVTLEGAVQTLDEKTMVLQGRDESPVVVVPREAIVGVDVRQRRSSKGKGAVIGAAAGLALGALLVASSDADERVLLLIPAVPIGTLLGVFVAPGGRWDRNVPLDRVRVSIGPVRGHGIGFSASLTF